MATVEISILMGIYNCEKTLGEAIDSILAQSFTDWELIMCDDGSTDQTYSVAEAYRRKFPEKIVLLKNSKNQGLNQTLNNCLKVARGRYIARMDGDDISLPLRLEKEYQFLESHPEYAIVSCPMIYFDENGEFRRGVGRGEPNPKNLVLGTIHPHAPCMVRRQAYMAVGGYTETKSRIRVEDWDLWIKMYGNGFRGYNLEKPLYKMRDDRSAYRRRKFKYRINEARVGASAVRKLRLSPIRYVFCLRPILVGLLPGFIYEVLHKTRR